MFFAPSEPFSRTWGFEALVEPCFASAAFGCRCKRSLMSAEPIYLVVDSGSPVTEFTNKDALKAYPKRKRGTFNRPLVYRIKDGHEPVIMTVSRVLAGGLDAGSKRHRS